MIFDVILVDQLLEHIEIQISGDILTASRGIGVEVYPIDLFSIGVQSYPGFRIVRGWRLFHYLEKMIVQRVFF